MADRRPALIFDYGNVVAFFDYSRACEGYGRRLGLTGPAFLTQMRERGLMELVHRYEWGGIDSETFFSGFGALSGLDLTYAEFASSWADIFTLNRPVVDLVARLKSNGYMLVLGSNTNAIHAAYFRREFAAALAPFDRLVLSYEVGHCKPESAFYHACADAADAPPRDCVFIDDLPENVAGARRAGLQAIEYREPTALRDSLRSLGIKVDTNES